MEVRFIVVHKICFLAVLSDTGVQLWSTDGDNMIFYYPLSTLLGNEMVDSRFMKGVAASAQFFFVGCSTGNVLVFDSAHGGSNFPLAHRLDAVLGVPISAVSCSSTLLAAGNDLGGIKLFKINEAFEQCAEFPGTSAPCLNLVQTEGVLMAGFSSGHIRIYRTSDTGGINELTTEITAHTRMVSGLDYQESTRLLLSCSPDQQVHVWSIPKFSSKSDSSVECVTSECVVNRVLTGVSFISEDRIAVAAYDEDDIITYTRQSI